ncbi:hypothetical protein DW839_22895 [Enterocloster bolteae]|jgi:hypothetical protein|uniref:Uncharacterized protein n=1 Tax=Enterocloster bolteae TaxID=208479 RepID=A0A414AQ60_9FIRM|nr:hypothetical protein DW839_22895 [Enterocloster bolteae]
MDSMNQNCMAYFQEEVRQYKIMLDGVLSKEYREYLIRKLLMFQYVINLLKECGDDNTKTT